MEERVVNILLDIKADIGGLKKDVGELKQGQKRLEADVADIKVKAGNLEADMVEVKSTVNALGDALLQTSREVKQIKAKG